MTATIEIEMEDAIYMKLITDRGTMQELSDYFSFRPANYKFHPKFKSRMWDGYIRLYSPFKPYLYVGLLHALEEFCKERNIKLICPPMVSGDDISDTYISELCNSINCQLTPYDYQLKYINNAIRSGRSLNLSPTSSGKSLIQYLIASHYIKSYNYRVLIIVPRIQLTRQMKSDFVSYNCDENMIGLLGDGVKTDSGNKIMIGTWQTLINMPQEFFDTFDVVLGDEAHSFESKSLTEIMSKIPHIHFRHGFTGTISTESKIHALILEGMFGKLSKYISTSDMIAKQVAADFKVKALLLNYNKEDKSLFRKAIKEVKEGKQKYPTEKNFINANESRNIFIRNLVWSLEGKNNLIFFDNVEKHGKQLAEMLQKEGRVLFFIHGGVSVDKREAMRHAIENDPIKRYDIVASSGTTSTGVSIKRIDNAIFTSGSKGEVKTFQSIGRLLRKGNGSDDTVLYDIGDMLSSTSNPNYSYQHFAKRIEMYNNENFNYKVYNIDLK